MTLKLIFRFIRSFWLIAIVFLIVSFSSCKMDESRYHLFGGELLDEERMSEIKNELLGGAESDTVSATVTEEFPNAESERENTDSNSEAEEKTEDLTQTVYWAKSGEVWHRSNECGYLKKSSEISSGTVEEAIEAGKERLCLICGK